MADVTSYIYRNWQYGSDFITNQATATDTGLITITQTVAASSSEVITVAYDDATVSAIFISVDKDGTTLNPDSGTSTTLTFTDALIPFIWQTNCNYVNPWNDAFSSLTATNGSAVDACIVQIRILYTV